METGTYFAFYSSIAFVFYIYVGYPTLLFFWCRLAGRTPHKAVYEPTVSIIVAAYNEGANIERRILNLKALDYPAGKVQIILSLDGSTDETESIAKAFATTRMRVLASEEHCGKAEALNYAVSSATGEILVFVDARQSLESGAVRALVSNFKDSSVGAVTGELLLLDASGKEAGDAVGLYWRYEKAIRSLESDIHSTLGATGALYAMRRELYRAIPRHTILDDVAIPMNVVLEGKRIVFDRSARAYDVVQGSPEIEFNRKVRTLNGNFQLLRQMPQLLLPWRNPVFLQFMSHKVGRLLVPYFLLTLFVSNLFLRAPMYRLFLSFQCAWYLLASVGAVMSRRQGARQAAR